MFRFDHDTSQTGFGGPVRQCRIGRSPDLNLPALNVSRHRRFTGPATAGCAGEALARP